MNIPRIIIAAAIVLSVYGGANYYIARRLYQWFNVLSVDINLKVYTCVFVLLALSLFLGFAPLPSGVRYVFSWIGAYWTGFFVYLLVFTIIADISMVLVSLTRIIPNPAPQSVLFCRGLVVLLLTVGIVSYGLYNGNQIRHVSYEISLRDAALDDTKIVLISDLHLGATNSLEKNLEKMVKTINDLKPDVVCIAGDIFNDNFSALRDPERAISLFRDVDATYGVYACLGNHDGGSSLPQMIEFLEKSNIRLLKDEHVVIDGRLALFGRLDPSPIGGSEGLMRQDIADAITLAAADMPVIVMDHNPSYINEYGSETGLILAGHTHRGQIFPGSLITGAMYAADYGHYQTHNESPHVITTSGIGTWGPPMRIGTNNEIVSIVLR